MCVFQYFYRKIFYYCILHYHWDGKLLKWDIRLKILVRVTAWTLFWILLIIGLFNFTLINRNVMYTANKFDSYCKIISNNTSQKLFCNINIFSIFILINEFIHTCYSLSFVNWFFQIKFLIFMVFTKFFFPIVSVNTSVNVPVVQYRWWLFVQL